MADHERIWLEPGEGAEDTGRQWCQDNVWIGEPATEYVRADIAHAAYRENLVAWLLDMAARYVVDPKRPLAKASPPAAWLAIAAALERGEPEAWAKQRNDR